MIYDVKITRQARLDMKMIYEYIAVTLMEPVTAEKQYTHIKNYVWQKEHGKGIGRYGIRKSIKKQFGVVAQVVEV